MRSSTPRALHVRLGLGRRCLKSRRHRRPYDFRLNSRHQDRKIQPGRHREPVNKTRIRMSNYEQQRKQTQIRYPMAYRRPYQVAHISQAEKGQMYLCLGCDEEMIPKQGKIKRHHFAHRGLAERCDPDNALHENRQGSNPTGVPHRAGGRSELPPEILVREVRRTDLNERSTTRGRNCHGKSGGGWYQVRLGHDQERRQESPGSSSRSWFTTTWRSRPRTGT